MRKTYIDNIRWITVTLVVIYHVIYMFNGVTEYGVIGPFSDKQPQDVYQYIVYPWFMLLLFVVSGMSARFELQKQTDKEFRKARTRKLLVPSTIGLLVIGWAMGYYNMLIGGAFTADNMAAVPRLIYYLILCVSGTGPLWYIQLLWLYCIVLTWIRKLEQDRLYKLCSKANTPIVLALTVLIYASAQILNTPIVVVYRFGIYGAGFFIGYFVFSHDEVMEKLGKNWILFTVLAIISGIAFVISYWGQSYADHVVLDTLFCNIYAWLGTVAVLAFMYRWGNFENAFSKWMCKKSWGLYIFHYFPLAVVAWYLKQFAPNMAPVFVYILVAIAAFAGAFALYEIFSRIPVVRWCVLGIKKEVKS